MVEIIVENKDLRIVRLELGSWATNAYIVVCPQTAESALIDVPPGARTIVKTLKGTVLKYMLLTHSHIDHIYGLRATRLRVQAPLAVHLKDNRNWLPFPPEIILKGGETLRLGKLQIESFYTPGHTPGSMCYKISKYLFSGDTIFPGGPGRTLTPPTFHQIVKSITKNILVLPDETMIYPGHGQSTVLKKEKAEFTLFASKSHDPKLCGDVVWLTS